MLSLDGSCLIENVRDGPTATVALILDRYVHRLSTPTFNNMALLTFARS